jgi:hypothetical protein
MDKLQKTIEQIQPMTVRKDMSDQFDKEYKTHNVVNGSIIGIKILADDYDNFCIEVASNMSRLKEANELFLSTIIDLNKRIELLEKQNVKSELAKLRAK